MLDDNRLVKLKASLADVIQKWIDTESNGNDFDALNTYLGDFTSELMAESAFTILLAQMQLSDYLERENLLKE